MLSSTAQFTILPGKEAEAEAIIKNLIAAVEANESGCLLYRWHRGVKDPLLVFIWEIFADQDAIEAHRGMAHMKDFNHSFASAFDTASVKITRYEKIAAVERFDKLAQS
jgi:quinol monooxygenase YgiN